MPVIIGVDPHEARHTAVAIFDSKRIRRVAPQPGMKRSRRQSAFGLVGVALQDVVEASLQSPSTGDNEIRSLMEGMIMSIIEDIQQRSAHIHWPETVVPEEVDLFAHNDIVIAAPMEMIWRQLVHASSWPNWYSNASDVKVDAPSGLLDAGVTFDWITFGAHIHSTVHEFEPSSRIGWYGQTDQWLAYHTWLLEPRGEGSTYVVMEETGTGANPKKLADSNLGHMHRGHDLWNISLKFLCEST